MKWPDDKVEITFCLPPPGSTGQDEPAAFSAVSSLQGRRGVGRREGSHQGGDPRKRCVCGLNASMVMEICYVIVFNKHVYSFTGGYLPPDEIKERFDSNCITPVSLFSLYIYYL